MSAVETKTALIALQGMRSASADIAKATERLATGKRINQAADDPAGNAQAVRLKAEITSFTQVKRNITNADSQLRQAGDSLNSITEILVEMRSLALSSASENSAELRATNQASFAALADSIKDTVATTKFAGQTMFASGGSTATALVGINAADTKTLEFSDLSAATGGAFAAVAGISISASADASAAIVTIDEAIEAFSAEIAKVGGYQRSLSLISDSVDSTILNKTVQMRDITDTDYAQEATNLAAARIRQDASTAVLAQANSMTRTVADFLLKGAMG